MFATKSFAEQTIMSVNGRKHFLNTNVIEQRFMFSKITIPLSLEYFTFQRNIAGLYTRSKYNAEKSSKRIFLLSILSLFK